MDWWRSWHGAPTDHKWAVIAARSGVKVGIVSAIAWALLDYASQHKERGCVDGFDVETYAVYSGFSEQEINAVISAMQDKGVIVSGRFDKWVERQTKQEDKSTERSTKSRELKKGATDCNGTQRIATENSGVEQFPSSLISSNLILSEEDVLINSNDDFDKMRRICEIVTGLPASGEASINAIRGLIDSGCTEQDIRAGLGWLRSQGKTIRTLDKILGPAKVEMQKRVQKENASSISQPVAGRGRWLEDAGTGEKVWFPD